MGKESRSRVWEVQTQLYDTYGNPYVDIAALKARLDELHKSGELVSYAYIVHNRDTYTQAEADKAASEIAAGKQRKAIQMGEQKPEHIHLELQVSVARTLTAMAKWLSCPTLQVPPNWLVYVHRNDEGEMMSYEDKCAYLCHERQPDKAQYRYEEIVCTFDYAAMMQAYIARKARKGRSKASRAFVDAHVNAIAAGTETVADLVATHGYAVYEAHKTKYDHAAQHYMRTAYQGTGFRLTYLVTGPSTVGKTPLAKFLACSLFPEVANPRDVFYCVGDEGVSLQGYRGQPVIIWDDWRASTFVTHFGREVVFGSLFSVHPDPVEYNIKYGSVTLQHTVNIVTTIEGVDAFARALAGEYVDRMGNKHTSEEQQVLQAYKRIWGLSEVTEAEIRTLFNAGYFDREGLTDRGLAYYRQFEQLGLVQNRTAQLAAKYAPRLYGELGRRLVPEARERYEDFAAREAAKISDPALIDEADFGARLPVDAEIAKVQATVRAVLPDIERTKQEIWAAGPVRTWPDEPGPLASYDEDASDVMDNMPGVPEELAAFRREVSRWGERRDRERPDAHEETVAEMAAACRAYLLDGEAAGVVLGRLVAGDYSGEGVM